MRGKCTSLPASARSIRTPELLQPVSGPNHRAFLSHYFFATVLNTTLGGARCLLRRSRPCKSSTSSIYIATEGPTNTQTHLHSFLPYFSSLRTHSTGIIIDNPSSFKLQWQVDPCVSAGRACPNYLTIQFLLYLLGSVTIPTPALDRCEQPRGVFIFTFHTHLTLSHAKSTRSSITYNVVWSKFKSKVRKSSNRYLQKTPSY